MVNRKIKIITDDYADPEQGTGAVKITPAHDFNDYEVGVRNKLDIINIFTEDGKINENCPEEFIGLDRFEARKKILNKLVEKELLVKEEKIINKVPYGDRSNSIIEPFLTEQWFADAKKLSIKAKEIVTNKKTKFLYRLSLGFTATPVSPSIVSGLVVAIVIVSVVFSIGYFI